MTLLPILYRKTEFSRILQKESTIVTVLGRNSKPSHPTSTFVMNNPLDTGRRVRRVAETRPKRRPSGHGHLHPLGRSRLASRTTLGERDRRRARGNRAVHEHDGAARPRRSVGIVGGDRRALEHVTSRI